MNNSIIDYLSKYISLTEEEVRIFLSLNLIREYKKGAVLLREGDTARECYLVLSGCVRSYYIVDGEERTTDFFTENQPITPVSYITAQPSQYFIACLEDSVISVGNPERSKTLLQKIPKFEAVSNLINTERLAEKQVVADNYLNLSPEQRYVKLQETRPDLLNRVPQYMIASFLGIKPESLSRIRKRIAQQQHR